MELLRQALIFFHLLGMATLIGAFLLQRRAAVGEAFNSMWLVGGVLQLVTGLGLVGVAEADTDPVNYARVGVKLAVLLVILGLTLAYHRRADVPTWLVPALGLLTLMNVGVAVFYQ